MDGKFNYSCNFGKRNDRLASTHSIHNENFNNRIRERSMEKCLRTGPLETKSGLLAALYANKLSNSETFESCKKVNS